MPTYEFVCGSSRCPRKGESFDVRLPIADRDAACVRCPNCNSEARRQVVPSKAPTCVITRPLNHGGHTKERLLP